MSAVRRLPVVADLTLVTAGAMTANIAGYLLQLLAGRWLGVGGYSEFASLLAVQLLCAVPALALQNVVARELVQGASVAHLRALRWRCAVLVAVVVAVSVPIVTLAMQVSVGACIGALGAAPALVLASGEQGILQGAKRFRALAVVLGLVGICRVLPAVVVLALGGGAAQALVAGALGIVGAAVAARMIAGTHAEPKAGTEPNESTEGIDPVWVEETGLDLSAPDVPDIPGFSASEVEKDLEPSRTEAALTGSVESVAHRAESAPNARQAEPTATRRAADRGSTGQKGQHETARHEPVQATTAAADPIDAPTATTTDPSNSPERAGRRQAIRRRVAGSPWVGVRPVLRAAQVQAALMALSSADLIVVRMVLDPDDAGRYSLATMAAKIAFWLPQAVGVVLYPRMAQPAQSVVAIRSALAVLSGIGVAGVLGAVVAAPLAPLLAGQGYAPIQHLLWLFALQGALLAVLQGAILSAIAVDRTALAGVAWVGLLIEVVAMVVFARSVLAFIGTATIIAAITSVSVAVIVLRTARRATRH